MSEDDDPTLSAYDDTNRAFLQAFLARSTLTYKEARPILASIFSIHEEKEILPEEVTDSDISSYIARANRAISAFDLEIRYTLPTNASRGSDRIYALVNTTSDPLTQLATTYSSEELAFLKRVLDAMFETYNESRRADGEVCAVTEMQAVRLAKPNSADSRRQSAALNGGEAEAVTGQGLSLREAEKAIRGFVDDGWFEKSRSGFYTLSPRGLMELRSWLVATYNDPAAEDDEDDAGRVDKVKTCFVCKEILISGQRCADRACLVRIHDLCANTLFTNSNRGKACPKCKTAWTGKDFVGERTITTSEKYMQGRRRSGGTGHNQSSSQQVTATQTTRRDEASEEEPEDEED